jgi:hypothetical protein
MHNTLKILKRGGYPATVHAYPTYPALDTAQTREAQAERFISALDKYRQQHVHVDHIAPLINSIVRDAVYDEIVQDKAYRNDINPLQLTHRIPALPTGILTYIPPSQNRPLRTGRSSDRP